jgi:hypothetical protein
MVVHTVVHVSDSACVREASRQTCQSRAPGVDKGPDCRAGYRARPGEGGPGARRLTQHVAPARRVAIADATMRHGRKRRAKTFNGFKEHVALDVDSNVTREVGGCPANRSEHEAVELLVVDVVQRDGLAESKQVFGTPGALPQCRDGHDDPRSAREDRKKRTGCPCSLRM